MLDAYEAIRQCVEDLGGCKVVGHALRPELDPEDARDWLAHCLNRKKRDKLDLAQVQWIQRAACRSGHHDGNTAWSQGIGYRRGDPVTPEAELAEAKRDAAVSARRAEEAATRLFACMRAAGLKVDE